MTDARSAAARRELQLARRRYVEHRNWLTRVDRHIAQFKLDDHCNGSVLLSDDDVARVVNLLNERALNATRMIDAARDFAALLEADRAARDTGS